MSRGSVKPAGQLWRAARLTAVVATMVLIVGLLMAPKTALAALWDLTIPLVPASLLISPAIWRNVCPLGALNMLFNRKAAGRTPDARYLQVATTGGILLLAILVPARHFLFNTDGTALAMTIVAVAGAALALGAVFEVKAGYCNAWCPVLPVERLYGQRPLARMGNPHCDPCTLCVTGCLDIAPKKSIGTVLGEAARPGLPWLATPFGAFAAAFPGFVLGYYTATDGPLSSAGTVYLTVAGWAAASYGVTAVVTRVFDLDWAPAVRWLAAVAVSIYYWYAAEVITKRLGLLGPGTWTVRGLALALVAVWLWNSYSRHSPGLRRQL